MTAARIAIVAALLTACGEPPPPEAPAVAVPSARATSGTALETFFPLVDGHVYHYVTETDEGSEGMLLVRAKRSGDERGGLVTGEKVRRFRYAPDGVVLDRSIGGPVYVLKEPLSPGTEWRGEHGGTVTITQAAASVDVPAGHYEGCVETLEQRAGDRPIRVATTFCPEVGIVKLEATSGAQLERAVLQSYGPPVDLGPDGVRAISPE